MYFLDCYKNKSKLSRKFRGMRFFSFSKQREARINKEGCGDYDKSLLSTADLLLSFSRRNVVYVLRLSLFHSLVPLLDATGKERRRRRTGGRGLLTGDSLYHKQYIRCHGNRVPFNRPAWLKGKCRQTQSIATWTCFHRKKPMRLLLHMFVCLLPVHGFGRLGRTCSTRTVRKMRWQSDQQLDVSCF